jgi:hypothetical protein
VAAAIGCGGNGTSQGDAPSSDQQAIISVMNDARTALLAGDADQVCALLTAHGQHRAMGFHVDYDNYGKIPPNDPRLPQNCGEMVDRLYADAHQDNVNVSWPRDLTDAKFIVGQIANDRAKVTLKVQEAYGPVVHFDVVRTSSGWRIDDSDGVPVGY